MSSKQDRTYTRTAAQLESKYNFGKSFSEILGIANDAQTHAYKAEELAKEVEARVLNIDVLEELNVSAGTIEIKSQGLSIQSENFSLSADNGIKTTRGNIGLWDISDKGISKATNNYYVKFTAPENTTDDVLTVAKTSGGVVTDTPFYLKADGTVKMNKGYIGGWEITDYGIINTTTDSDGTEYTSGFEIRNNNSTNVFSIGSPSRTSWFNAPFRVTYNGEMYATKGAIGGFAITDTALETTSGYGLYVRNLDRKSGVSVINDSVNFLKWSGSSWGVTGSIFHSTSNNNIQLTGTWQIQSGFVTNSDARLKSSIEDLDERYDVFFDLIKSRRFIYNNGTSQRYHSGYITQEIQAALVEANIPEKEFAGIVTFGIGTAEEHSGLRYAEFVSLNTWQIQKLKKELADIKAKIGA